MTCGTDGSVGHIVQRNLWQWFAVGNENYSANITFARPSYLEINDEFIKLFRKRPLDRMTNPSKCFIKLLVVRQDTLFKAESGVKRCC